ncbi:MAG: choice-of-anchor J domain-containing protein, partial [Bacteroidales bacterium]|nr:choice-of-anchor J domain-containing protein [Bacteroidales bacterium]
MVQEWTMTAKGEGVPVVGRDGRQTRQGNWYLKSVDLSAFAGQKYVAIRHWNCSDMFYLDVDDVELSNGAKSDERHLEYFKVMCTSIDGEPIFNADTEHPFAQVETESLVPGDHYICKVAAFYSTGMSAWTECEWQYIPCTEYAGTVNGIEINGNTISWEYPDGGVTPPPGNGDTFSENFDNSQMPAGWTIIDGGSPTGYGWQIGSTKLGSTGNGHNGSNDLILSQSYDNNYGIVYPDNWFISPAVTLANGSTFSFWACGQDSGYAAEHCGVFVSTTGTNPSDFTMVNEWTLSAKAAGEKAAIRGDRAQGTWRQYTVDLSAYAGAGRYVAIRHFNCSDMFYLDVDDVELTNGAKDGRAAWEFFNGYVTDPGAMANGADASWTKGSQGTWGPNANYSAGSGSYYWLADSFTVDAATTISEIEVYGYQTGSSTTSTFTGMYAQIYNGAPNAGGTAIWGNTTSNIMTATAFTNCYRGSDGETTATTRPIMSITAGNLDIQLEAGTYYLVYALTGSSSSGPWGAPHAEPGVGNTGNGYQCTSSGWTALSDSGSGTSYGCSMKLTGTTGGGTGPTPTGDLLGAMIFADGEWEAFVEYPTNEYVYEGDAEEVCVRMVYNGTNTLPEGNIYYSMSCPECEAWNGQPFCEAGADIHSELVDANHIKVWWGEEPAAPVSDWLYYDNGTNDD